MPALARHFGKATETRRPRPRCSAPRLADAVFVDQSPIGKTARSNPVSYVGAWTNSALFRRRPSERERSYTATKFSFNAATALPHLRRLGLRACRDAVPVRRLPALPRLRRPPLPRRGAGRPGCAGGRCAMSNVADVLDLTVAEARPHRFRRDREVVAPAAAHRRRRLDYVRLASRCRRCRAASAARLKLAGFLAEARPPPSQALAWPKGTLFLFDEPTTGLHFDDIAQLMRALRKLLDAGHSLR